MHNLLIDLLNEKISNYKAVQNEMITKIGELKDFVH